MKGSINPTRDEGIVRSLIAVVEILRPGNVVIMFFGVVVGAAIEGGFHMLLEQANRLNIIVAGLSVAAIGAGANALNDYCDVEPDSINRPDRPIPSGRIQRNTALRLAIVLLTLGILAGYQVSVVHGFVALFSAALLIVYNRHLKRLGVVGNVVVALMTAVSILYGGIIVGTGQVALIGALFAFLLTMAREIVKDIDDVEGDKLLQSSSIPSLYGSRIAVRFALAFVILTIILLPGPFLFANFDDLYMVAIVPAGLALLHAGIKTSDSRNIRYVSRLLKVSMFLGMVALVLGRLSE